MADANLNARPAHPERHVTIQQSWRYRQWKPGYRPDPPLFPWFKVSGRGSSTPDSNPGSDSRSRSSNSGS